MKRPLWYERIGRRYRCWVTGSTKKFYLSSRRDLRAVADALNLWETPWSDT